MSLLLDAIRREAICCLLCAILMVRGTVLTAYGKEASLSRQQSGPLLVNGSERWFVHL